jgi:membrane protein required for colicin V production
MRVTDFNGFDWILTLTLLVSVGMGARRGVIRSVVELAGFIGGFMLAAGNYTTWGDWMCDVHMMKSPPMARVVAFLLIVVLVVVAAELLARLMHKTLHAAGLGLVDRFLGAVFGFARGCLIGIALVLIPTTFAPQSKVIATSVLSPYLFALAHDVSFLVPQYLLDQMTGGAVNFKQSPLHWINRH